MHSDKMDDQGTAELWYGLRSAFLSALDDDQKLRIFDLTTRASRELHRWAARYPLIRRVRVWPLSLSVTAAAPFASVAALVTMARMNLWTFAIDDLFDEEMVPFAELRRRVARYNAILGGLRFDPKREQDTLARALQDIRDDLNTYALFPALQEAWVDAVARTLDSMMREYEWRTFYSAKDRQEVLPDYETYLSYSVYSGGGPQHIWTALIAVDDASVLDHLERLKEMGRTASLCIRLANDLQSYSKELSEGKINAIIILQREAMARGLSSEDALMEACEIAREEIAHGLSRCVQLQQQARTATGHPERAIIDIARFFYDFSSHYDYHTFATGSGRS